MKNNELFKVAEETFEECKTIMQLKNHDYATGAVQDSDALQNFKLVEHLSITDMQSGILVRLCDKFSRLTNIYKSGNHVKEESLEDTLNDIINYVVIFKAARKEEHDRQAAGTHSR